MEDNRFFLGWSGIDQIPSTNRIMKDSMAPAKTFPENLSRIFHIFTFMSKGKIFIYPPSNRLNTLTPLHKIILSGIRITPSNHPTVFVTPKDP